MQLLVFTLLSCYFSHALKKEKKRKPPKTTHLQPPCPFLVFPFSKYSKKTHFGGGALALLGLGLWRGEAGGGWAPGRRWQAEGSSSSVRCRA